jgi:hypothetical protein
MNGHTVAIAFSSDSRGEHTVTALAHGHDSSFLTDLNTTGLDTEISDPAAGSCEHTLQFESMS